MDLASKAKSGGNFKRWSLKFGVYRCHSALERTKSPQHTWVIRKGSFLCVLPEGKSTVIQLLASRGKSQVTSKDQSSQAPSGTDPSRKRATHYRGRGPRVSEKWFPPFLAPRNLPVWGPYPFSLELEPCGPTRDQVCGPKKLRVRCVY